MKIAVITGSRADFGLLQPILKKLIEDDYFDLSLVATGSHFSLKHGFTSKEIEKTGFIIDHAIDLKIQNTKTGKFN